jgi:hypothetical protein
MMIMMMSTITIPLTKYSITNYNRLKGIYQTSFAQFKFNYLISQLRDTKKYSTNIQHYTIKLLIVYET